MNLNNIYIQEAYKKGYRVLPNGVVVSPAGRVRKLVKGRGGYLSFNVRINGVSKSIVLHRFCAYQKYGDIIFSCDCVRHLDGNKYNNSIDNIEIGTHSDNATDIPKEIRVSRARNNIVHYDMKGIIEYYKVKSYSKTMERFGISSKGTLHFIIHHRIADKLYGKSRPS